MKTLLIFLTTLSISFSIYADKLTIYTYDSFVSEWGPGPIIEKIFEELSQSGGFESVNLSAGVDILSEMISDKQCLKFISFVGAVVSTGLRGILKDMLKNKWFDVAITTCGALGFLPSMTRPARSFAGTILTYP